jgi:hypothetical protein
MEKKRKQGYRKKRERRRSRLTGDTDRRTGAMENREGEEVTRAGGRSWRSHTLVDGSDTRGIELVLAVGVLEATTIFLVGAVEADLFVLLGVAVVGVLVGSVERCSTKGEPLRVR